MKKTLTLIILSMSITLFATAQTKNITLQTNGRQISKIDVCCGFKVNVTKGNVSSAVMTVPDKYASKVIFKLENDGNLKIGFERNTNINSNSGDMIVNIVCPTLVGIDISSGARIDINSPFTVSNLAIEASSGSKVVANSAITVNGECDIDASSAARIELKGSVNALKVDASSAARIECKELVAQIADIEASSAANVSVKATKTVKIDKSSGASVTYDCPANGVSID